MVTPPVMYDLIFSALPWVSMVGFYNVLVAPAVLKTKTYQH